MKNIKSLIIVLLIPFINVNARNLDKDSLSTNYQVNEEWYIQLQGGMNYLVAENTRFVNFWEVLSPQMAFSIGKRFSPVWGARLQFVAGKDKGVYFAHDKKSPKYSFVHQGVLGIGTFSLTDFLNRKKRDFSQKKWNVSALLGLGTLYTSFKDPAKIGTYNMDFNNRLYLSFFGGVEVARNLSPEWDVNFELSTNWMNNKYNGQKTVTNSFFKADGIINLLVGVRYTFNSTKRKNKMKVVTSDENRVMHPIIGSKESIKQTIVIEPQPIPVKTEVYYSIEDLLEMIENKEPIREKKLSSTERVYFDYGKSTIKTFTSIYLDKVVELMNKTNIVLVIKGYSFNKVNITENSLTEQRMNAVRDYLLKHGIERARLVYQYIELPESSNNSTDLKQIVEFGILSL